MKTLFQQQCEALVATLTKAKDNERNALDMGHWTNDEHACGTAACVCGYQALSNDLDLFEEAMGRDNTIFDVDDIAKAISDDLKNSCDHLFNNDYLAKSIYTGNAIGRIYFVKCAKVASIDKLQTFRHFTSDNPSLDDAIEYINFVIQKCKERAA